MAKKSKKKGTPPSATVTAEKNIAVSKQAVGGVTGAVLGAMVGGPVGAIAGGVAGTMVGEQSARGKRPVARTAEAIGEEIRKGTPIKALKAVANATTSLGRARKPSAKSTSAAKKKTSRKKVARKSKAKSPKKGTTAKKRAKKKVTKKKR